jgi:hypothetical protein
MSSWRQFNKISELVAHLEENLTYGVSSHKDVQSLLEKDSISYYQTFFRHDYLKNQDHRWLNIHDEYDTVFQVSMFVKQRHWLFFTLEFIWIIRFHFNNGVLVEIVTAQIEQGPM